MDMNDAIMNMPRGWIVVYNDGIIITQYDVDGKEVDWKKVPKRGIKSLTLKWGPHKKWTIAGKQCYLQSKRGWISPGMTTPVIEERCIGYWEGNNKVMYRVNENTGRMEMSVTDISKK